MNLNLFLLRRCHNDNSICVIDDIRLYYDLEDKVMHELKIILSFITKIYWQKNQKIDDIVSDNTDLILRDYGNISMVDGKYEFMKEIVKNDLSSQFDSNQLNFFVLILFCNKQFSLI